MRETGTNLNYDKVEFDPRTPDFKIALERALESYSLKKQAFRNPKEEVIKGALRLLIGYDIAPSFTYDAERNLLTLAIADTWISSTNIQDQKSLLDVLKLIAVDMEEMNTLSGKVKVLAERGMARGREFYPDGDENGFKEWINKLIDWGNSFRDESATSKVLESMEDWEPEAKLAKVRSKLGVTPGTEKPVKIIVLTKSAEEMLEELKCTSYYLKGPEGTYLVFNADYEEADSLEHEYAHSQSEGLNSWYGYLIFRGLNEALTEASKTKPYTYPEQRALLNAILEEHPEYENLLYEAYMGDESSRRNILSRISNDYGLEGLLLIARLSALSDLSLAIGAEKKIYISPDSVIDQLKKLGGSPIS